MGGGGGLLTAINPMAGLNLFGAKKLGLTGGGTPAPGASPYESMLAQIAQDTYSQTDPLRQGFLQQMSSLLSGGFDPQKTAMYQPMYNAARSGPEAQYNVARENVLAGTPRGGGQIQGLANVESARASEVGSIPGMLSNQIFEDMMQKAYGTAFGAPQQSMAGLGAAAGTFGNRMSMAQQAASAQNSALFSGLGTMGGLALGGPGGALAGKGAGKSLGGKK